ncbi:MAG: hypothetical protein ACLSHR_11655 [Oscillospiraceae bacterium]
MPGGSAAMTYRGISDKLAIEFPCFQTHDGLGPSDQQLTAEYLHEKLKNKKNSHQNCSAGSGDYLRNRQYMALEALFERLPFCRHERPAASSRTECGKPLSAVREVLEKSNQSAGGSTLRDYRKPDGSLGCFREPALRFLVTKPDSPAGLRTCSPARTWGIRENRSGRTFNLLLSYQTKVKSHDKKHL